LVALSRPHHYVLFVLFLGGLFLATFQITQAAISQPAPEDESESLPVLRFVDEPLAAAAPEALPRPDLSIASLTTRECVSTTDRPGGLLTVLIRNDGPGDVLGSRVYASANVRNTETGGAVDFERHVWVDRMGPGEERVIELGYAFPQRDTIVAGAVAAPQPVPGSYRIDVVLDHSKDFEMLGDAGIVEETDETNNSGQTSTSGVADGVC